MMRFAMIGMVLILSAPAAQAETDEEKAARCSQQAALIGGLVAQRSDGASVQDAIPAVREAHADMDDRYVALVPVLADWVYSLPQEQLGAGVADSFEAACVGYDA